MSPFILASQMSLIDWLVVTVPDMVECIRHEVLALILILVDWNAAYYIRGLPQK